MKNIIQTSWTQGDRERFDELLGQLEALAVGKVTALTAEERVSYGSVNEQNKLLVNKTLDFRQNQTNFSSSINLPSLKTIRTNDPTFCFSSTAFRLSSLS